MSAMSSAELKEMLDNILSDNVHSKALYRFTKREFSTENVYFLLAVRQLNPALGVAGHRVIPDEKQGDDERAKYIYDSFIPNEARAQVNLPSAMRLSLESEADAGQLGRYSFDEAYGEIFSLVVKDSVQRFKREYDTEWIVSTRARSSSVETGRLRRRAVDSK